jgi:excisionase family DNA binding protein
MAKDELLTATQVSNRLTLKKRTVLRWMREGKLAHIDLGKSKRVRSSDLEAFLASRRRHGQL